MSREKAFGRKDPKILKSLEDYAALLRLMNREEEAKKLDARRPAILTK